MLHPTAVIGLGLALWCAAPQDGRRDPPPTAEQARVAKSMGEQLFRAGKHKAALERWNVVLRHNAADPVAWYFRAACHAGVGDAAAGLADTNKALALLPRWPKALAMRAGLKLLLGDYDGTIADQKRAIDLEREAGTPPHPRWLAVIEQATRMKDAVDKIKLGAAAPDVRLRDADRTSIRLSDLRDPEAPGALVMVFHGGFGSPSSLMQLARMREFQKRIEGCRARIVAVSRDTPTENKILAEEKGLAFPLLSDVDGVTSETYGFVDVLRPGAPAGTLLGIVVVDAAGKLRHRQAFINPARHAIDFKSFITQLSTITGVKPPKSDEDGKDGKDGNDGNDGKQDNGNDKKDSGTGSDGK
jgi:peroxiredoxin